MIQNCNFFLISFAPMIKTHTQSFLFCLLYCWGIGLSHAQSFVENTGQLKDQHGNPNEYVLFSAVYGQFRVLLNKQGFSYETIEIQRNTNEDSPELTINFNRVDVELLNHTFSGQIMTEDFVGHDKFYQGEFLHESNHFKKVTYKSVYTNIDLVFYANPDGFKYDFVLHPGADLRAIQMFFKSPFETNLIYNEIVIEMPLGTLTEQVPFSYLKESNRALDIKFSRPLHGDFGQIFSFSAPNDAYSFEETLIIDPIPNVWFSTYISGNLDEFPENVTLDANGDIYVTGYTNSVNNIATTGTFQGSFQAVYDVFLIKYKSDGAKIWGTYMGGNSFDRAYGIAYKNGFIYICGNSFSQNLATPGVHQTNNINADDAFIAKFDLQGNRIWCTYYGGPAHDFAASIVVNNSNEIYITGHTLSYSNISTAGAHMESFFGISAAFLSKFSSQGLLIWGTYYGGLFEEGYGIALDSDENIVFSGFTNSSNGIASPGAQQTTNAGGFDAFLTKFSPNGTRLWGTYFGGPADDKGYDVCIDANNNIFVVGNTSSLSGISSGNVFQPSAGSIDDGFVAKYNANGTRLWSSYVGGSEAEYINAVALYFDQGIVIAGKTQSSSNIASNGALSGNLAGQYDAFLMKLSPNGAYEWGSYFGGPLSDEFTGLAIDLTNGYINAAGNTLSASGIATTNAHQTNAGPGLFHGFLARFCAPFIPNLITEIQPVSCGSSNFSIDIEPIDVFSQFVWHDSSNNPFYNFINLEQGQYFFTLSTTDTNNCSFTIDTFFFQVIPDVSLEVEILYDQTTLFCQGTSLNLQASDTFDSYLWSNGSIASETSLPLEITGSQFITLTVADTNGCLAVDTLIFEILEAPDPQIQVFGAANFCIGEPVHALTSPAYVSYLWNTGDTGFETEIFEDAWVWVLATNEFGCTSLSDSIFISSTNLSPQIALTNNTPICPNFELNFALNNSFNSYTWSNGETTSTTQTTAIPGEQWMAIQVGNLCGGSGFDTLFYSVLPDIDLSINASVPALLCVGSQVFMNVNNTFSNVMWQNTHIGSSYNESALSSGTWIISVQALDNNLCPVYDTLSLTVGNCVLDTPEKNAHWHIFPNPTNDKLMIHSFSTVIGQIDLIDAAGRRINTHSFNGNMIELSLENYNTGIYFVHIYDYSGNLITVERVSKSH